ncbi:alpha/beta hydrolase [Cellulomonas bogoriensis]|nr:alpha/beta hydrolase [Cellulomonas bogoriensis]
MRITGFRRALVAAVAAAATAGTATAGSAVPQEAADPTVQTAGQTGVGTAVATAVDERTDRVAEALKRKRPRPKPTPTPTANPEAVKVDRVPTPEPDWWNCSVLFGAGECAEIDLPLDYDEPDGEKTTVAVLRVKARDQANKIGTLFLNPGGPGGSGVWIAADAEWFLSDEVLDRFDIVGFDPRGINYSSNVTCWRNQGEAYAALEGMFVPFPLGRTQEAAYIGSAKAFGRSCSESGNPLAGSMSTAQVARDMDVLRRMVGDDQLTYLGFSYGSQLGNVYANMFPERVRAVAIDGVLDPEAWVGTDANAGVPSTMRLRSGEAAHKGLTEVLDRCEAAGSDYCTLAGLGDPREVYAEIAASLRRSPLQFVDEETGEVYYEFTYGNLINWMLGNLYYPDAGYWIDQDLTMIYYELTGEYPEGVDEDEHAAAVRTALPLRVRTAQARGTVPESAPGPRSTTRFGFPYYNDNEAFASVLCTDGRNPARAEQWRQFAARADRSAPGFGPYWTWASAPCASSTWTVRDEDAWTGPFTNVTAHPVLVVGNYWDPATSYEGAQAVATQLPGSRLVSSDSWGHTAYGTSECATSAIDQYLIGQQLPEEGTVCVGDVQPFTERLTEPGELDLPDLDELRTMATDDEPGAPTSGEAGVPDRLPPVVPPVPGALPRR